MRTGIVIGGSGSGENRMQQDRRDPRTARVVHAESRANDANVLVMGAKVVTPSTEEIVGIWLVTAFRANASASTRADRLERGGSPEDATPSGHLEKLR
jgi:ribose 5-phosphate isomerase RpiB